MPGVAAARILDIRYPSRYPFSTRILLSLCGAPAYVHAKPKIALDSNSFMLFLPHKY
jgi:hypothetical protein